MLRRYASAAADVSDGLLADAGHIGKASGLGVQINLDRLALSPSAAAWLKLQPDRANALTMLASGGDDYEIVCTLDAAEAAEAIRQADAAGVSLTVIGCMTAELGVKAFFHSRLVEAVKTGWVHP